MAACAPFEVSNPGDTWLMRPDRFATIVGTRMIVHNMTRETARKPSKLATV
jgi:hypothetical protein